MMNAIAKSLRLKNNASHQGIEVLAVEDVRYRIADGGG
jgi:hypothetical protein